MSTMEKTTTKELIKYDGEHIERQYVINQIMVYHTNVLLRKVDSDDYQQQYDVEQFVDEYIDLIKDNDEYLIKKFEEIIR